MKRKILVTEEQLKYIINFIGSEDDLINEEISESIPNWGKKRKGELNFAAIPAGSYAYFKNNGLFEDLSDDTILIITSTSKSTKLIKKDDDQPPPPDEPVNIKIKLDLNDPFNFDKTTLTSNGESGYIDFINEYKKTKQTYIKYWDQYLTFIKQNGGLKLLGYASQDADPNAKDGGRLEACSKYGVGIGPRKEYNLCLSQKRADTIKERLIIDLPELNGLITSKGMGETCEFGPCWTKNRNATPRDTAPNRKFMINFPEYKTKINININQEKPIKNVSNKEIDWNTVDTYVDLSEYGGEGKYKAVKVEGGLRLEKGKIIQIRKSMGNKIPVISDARFNNETTGKAIIGDNGIKISAGDGETMFKGWKSIGDINRQSEFVDKSFYKQTDWVLSVYESGEYLLLRDYAIALSIAQ